MSLSLSVGAAFGRPGAASSRASLRAKSARLPTGNTLFDSLVDGGLPRTGFVECFTSGERRGEAGLLLQALANVKRVVWILPAQGFEPYAPAFEVAGIDLSRHLFVVPTSPAEAFECAEAALASGEADAVAAWLPALSLDEDRRCLARLELAASQKKALLLAVRPSSLACRSSAADLRLQFAPVRHGAEDLSRVRAVRRHLFSDSVAVAEVPLFEAVPTARLEPLPSERKPVQPSLFPELSAA